MKDPLVELSLVEQITWKNDGETEDSLLCFSNSQDTRRRSGIIRSLTAFFENPLVLPRHGYVKIMLEKIDKKDVRNKDMYIGTWLNDKQRGFRFQVSKD